MDLIMAVTRYKKGRSNTRQMLAQAKKEDGINRSREEDEGDCMLRAADRYRGKKC